MWLFSYGTLRDEAIQIKLFGTRLYMQKASLNGYAVTSDEDGFFNLTQSNNIVEGSVLLVNNNQLLRADQWEEIPLYERKIMSVLVNGIYMDAWVYFKDIAKEEYKYSNVNEISSLPDMELNKILDSFIAVRDLRIPIYDFYVWYKCSVVDRKRFNSKSYIKTQIRDIFCNEFGTLNLKCIGTLEIIYKEYPLKFIVYGTVQYDSVYMLVSMPVCLIHPKALIKTLSIQMNEFVGNLGMDVNQLYKCVIFSEEEWNEEQNNQYQVYITNDMFLEPYKIRILEEVVKLKELIINEF